MENKIAMKDKRHIQSQASNIMVHVISLRRRGKGKTPCAVKLSKLLWREGGLEVGK